MRCKKTDQKKKKKKKKVKCSNTNIAYLSHLGTGVLYLYFLQVCIFKYHIQK